MTWQAWLSIAVSLAAVGCGTVHTPYYTPVMPPSYPYVQPTPRLTPTPRPTRRPSPKPAAGKPKPSPAPSVKPVTTDPLKSLMAEVKQSLSQVRTLRATIDSWNTNGQKSETVQTRMSFMQPDQNRVEIIQSTNSSAEGSKVVWSGTTSVTVRAKVVFVPITLTLQQTDDRLVNARGYTVADVGLKRLIDILLHPEAKLKLLGTSSLGGRGLLMVELTSPLSPSDATKEIVGIDQQTKLPVLRQVFSGSEMVFRTHLSNVEINPALDGSTFNL